MIRLALNIRPSALAAAHLDMVMRGGVI